MKTNRNYLKLFKPCMIACAVVLAISIVITAIFGFNKGVDFTGGTNLVVKNLSTVASIDVENTEAFKQAESDIVSVLNANGVRVNSLQVQDEYAEKHFVLTIAEKNADKVSKIRLDLNEKLNKTNFDNLGSDILEGNLDITRGTSEIVGFIETSSFFITIYTAIFLLALLVFYACFRVKVGGALAMGLSALFDVILTLCFVTLARIEVNAYVFASMIAILFMSVYASIEFMFDVKEKSKDLNFAGKTNYELANIVIESNFKRNLIVASCIAVCAVALMFTGIANILHIALVVFAGNAVVFASHIFVAPAIWHMLNPKRQIAPVKNIVENKKDKDAEVVEVK